MTRSAVLIGYRGTGKTTVGKLLAEKLALKFADIDQLIEETRQETIAAIFARGGESLFRRYETEQLRFLASSALPMIIAAGGGTPLREENRLILRSMAPGRIIFLTAEPETIANRLTSDCRTSETRPPLTQLSFREEIISVLKIRIPIYESLADQIIATDGKTPIEIADEILLSFGCPSKNFPEPPH